VKALPRTVLRTFPIGTGANSPPFPRPAWRGIVEGDDPLPGDEALATIEGAASRQREPQ